MTLFRTLATALAVAICLTRSLAAADGRQRFLEHAPASACLAVYSGDLSATCAAFQDTRIGRKLCGDPFAPLVAELTKRDRASALRLRPMFGFDWSDVAETKDPGGLLVFPAGDGALGVVWLFTPTEMIRETPGCLSAAEKYFNDKGFHAASSAGSGVNFSVFTPPPSSESDGSRVLFTTPTLYGVANSQAAADAVLAVRTDASLGRQPALASQTGVPGRGPAEGRNDGSAGDSSQVADVRFFLRPFELWELVRARNQAAAPSNGAGTADDDEPRENEVAAARRLGLSAVASLVGRVRFDAADPCEWTLDATVQVKRPYGGALRLLELRPGPLPELPEWIPPEVTSAGVWRWDFPQAMKGFGSLYDQTNEPGPDGEGLFEDMLDGLRDDPEGVQVDLRRELFEQMLPEVARISDPGEPTPAASSSDSEPNAPDRRLYVAKVRNSSQVIDALARFYKGDERVRRQMWGSYNVWTVGENASLFVEGESDALVTVRGLAVGDGELIFSTDVSLLRDAVTKKSGGAKLADDDGWNRLLDWCATLRSDATAYQSLLRPDRMLEPSYRAAAAGPPPEPPADESEVESAADEPLAARLWRLLLFGDPAESQDVPYSAAPRFDVLRDALPQGALVVSQTDDGWNIRFGVVEPSGQEF